MQSRNAYILGSFVIPEGATSGARIVFDAEIGRILIYDASNNLILSMSPVSGTDGSGNQVLDGIVSYQPNGSTYLTLRMTTDGDIEALPAPGMPAILTNGLIQFGGPSGGPSQASGALTVRIPSNHASVSALLGFSSPSADGTVAPQGFIGVERTNSGNFDALCNSYRLNVCGFIIRNTFIGNNGGLQEENWNTPALPGGWSAPVPVQYKLFPDGLVRLRGIADGPVSPVPNGTVLFTLPAAYRPTQYTLIPNAYDASATKGRIEVQTTGQVSVYDAPNDKPCLDGIAFSVI